jgi:hypothetical protein
MLTQIDREYLSFLAHQQREKRLLFQFQKDIYAIFNRKYEYQ